jgi:hypothetical protein
MSGEPVSTLTPVNLDLESFRQAAKVYSQQGYVFATNEEVGIIFGTVFPQDTSAGGVTQTVMAHTVVYVSRDHFLRMAKAFAEAALRIEGGTT